MRYRYILSLLLCIGHWRLVKTLHLDSKKSSSSDQIKIYNDGLTTAVTIYDRDGKIKRCSLYMERKEDRPRNLTDPALHGIAPTSIEFSDMMAVMAECQLVDKAASNTNKTAPYSTFWSFLRGILPGTKWCGMGDIARNWEDLGYKRELDKCCRTHDHCPVRILAFTNKFGLSNLSLHTKSHCECDKRFYNCLKSENSTAASGIGDFYFNIVKGDCVAEDADPSCAEQGIERCGKQQTEKSQTKQFKFTSSKLVWERSTGGL